MTYDCIIIGAGAAGLTCARELINAGYKTLMLEGRDRIGGRIFSARLRDRYPIELGAEFIHGAPKVTFDRLEAAGLTFYDLTDHHVQRKGDTFAPMDFFEKIGEVMESLDENRKRDRSMHDALEARNLEPNLRKLLKAYIEGFHAADLNLIGERALALSEKGGDDLNGSESFRVTEGYDKLIESLAPTAQIKLNTVVKKIESTKKSVAVTAHTHLDRKEIFHARAVVVSVPLGVLKAPKGAHAAIEFSPRPKALDHAISSLHMGHALRLNLKFATRFWEKLSKEPLGYLHAGPEWDFPTWWSQMPMRTSILTAWQGGPRAAELAELSEKEKVHTAIKTLSYLLDVKAAKIEDELQAWFAHDWSRDPFSLGAYSYVGLDGDRKAKALAEPQGALFFTGEHTHTAAERGTVDGAIDTGLRTAKQVLKFL